MSRLIDEHRHLIAEAHRIPASPSMIRRLEDLLESHEGSEEEREAAAQELLALWRSQLGTE